MRILIVEDDEVGLQALIHTLLEAGHEVDIARSGQEALRVLCDGSCRVVISDWAMPEMDGLELCRRIRREMFGGYVYVILLTARTDKKDIVEGLSAGADEFLCKPFHPAELRSRLRTADRILTLESREVAIFAMAKLVEARDQQTGDHLERMRNYSLILAQDLAESEEFRGIVDEEYIQLMYLTSPLHDIGKVAIPDAVLLKPGRLNDREFEIMKTHTTLGAETLDDALRRYPGVVYLRLARYIVLTHHERFDGSGYPGGLKGEDIPLCGRIVALADVYDALTSKRVYKPAFAHDVARSMIEVEAGCHFDPLVVDAFLRNEQRFVDMRERFSQEEVAASA